jgi:flagellar basal body-associated protein FliL
MGKLFLNIAMLTALSLFVACGSGETGKPAELNVKLELTENTQLQLQKMVDQAVEKAIVRELSSMHDGGKALRAHQNRIRLEKIIEEATADEVIASVPIVDEGDFIVVQPANSRRYLMVEIQLLRAEWADHQFSEAVNAKQKILQDRVTEYLSNKDEVELADPAARKNAKSDLLILFQDVLGSEHPIKEVIISKWVMQ